MKRRILLVVALGFVVAVTHAAESSEAARADVERAVLGTLDDFMAAWNAKDLAAWERTMHFPHYRLASGQMQVLDRAGTQDASRIWTRIGDGWHHSAWDHRRIVHFSADKVHVDTRFSRYRADGSRIGAYDSLYVLTKEKGRWGVKLRSSFAQ